MRNLRFYRAHKQTLISGSSCGASPLCKRLAMIWIMIVSQALQELHPDRELDLQVGAEGVIDSVAESTLTLLGKGTNVTAAGL